MPTLETARLVIRPFEPTDLSNIHAILAEAFPSDPPVTLQARRQWLDWTVMNYEQLAQLHQPPYGDRAIVIRATGDLIGACGYSQCLCPFGQMPGFPELSGHSVTARYTTEIGLFYAMASAHRRRGYTAEAAGALIAYGFKALMLKRIVATTSYDNQGSIAVMRRAGMVILKNSVPDPYWLQVVGVLESSAWQGAM